MNDKDKKWVVEFLLRGENQELLDNGDFEELYGRYPKSDYYVGGLTEILVEALGCNESELLEHFSSIPQNFLSGIDPSIRETLIVSVPNHITSINDSAFKNCTALTEVKLHNNITSIGDYAFYNCQSLTTVTIPGNVTRIGMAAFMQCTSLESVIIPDSVTYIGDQAFDECYLLTGITLPKNLGYIGYCVFEEYSAPVSVTYKGTAIEFNRITKNAKWNGKGEITVRCIDRDLIYKGANTYASMYE